jgi:quercetin dioxygenase-like cupin family protein
MYENNNYQDKINRLRAERVEARVEFRTITDTIIETIKGLNGQAKMPMVTIKQFQDVPLNELVVLSDKVSFVKVLQSENEMHFKTFLKAGGKYGIHAHDCDEYATVIKGHLVELLNHNKVYTEGETVVYLANTLHEPSCQIDSEYYVIFKT